MGEGAHPLPHDTPEVQMKSEEWFSHRACNVAVHKFVHFLQHHSGRFDLNSCNDTDTREQEAFRVQRRFISEARGGFLMFGTPHLHCAPS